MPLSQLASVQIVEGPAQISREDTRRRIGVELNVRGRDIGSLVKQAEARCQTFVRLQSWLEFEVETNAAGTLPEVDHDAIG